MTTNMKAPNASSAIILPDGNTYVSRGGVITVPKQYVPQCLAAGLTLADGGDPSIPSADVSVGPLSAAEATLYSHPVVADQLVVGSSYEMDLFGIRSAVTGANGVATVKVKYNGVTLFTTTTAAGAVTDSPWHLKVVVTCRAVGNGTTGKLASFGIFDLDNTRNNMIKALVADIDTTLPQTLSVTIKHATSDAANVVTLQQAHTVCLNANV